MGLREIAVSQIRKHGRLIELAKQIASEVSPETVVVLDYPVSSRQRWNRATPHPQLYGIINAQRASYERTRTGVPSSSGPSSRHPQTADS